MCPKEEILPGGKEGRMEDAWPHQGEVGETRDASEAATLRSATVRFQSDHCESAIVIKLTLHVERPREDLESKDEVTFAFLKIGVWPEQRAAIWNSTRSKQHFFYLDLGLISLG
jgi:hypothetical protein